MTYRLNQCTLIILLLATMASAQEPAAITAMDHQITLSPQQLKCLQLALAELSKQSLDTAQYEAALYNIEEGYSVIFADPNLPASHRGGSVTVPGFEVVLDKQCRVIRAHFSR